MRIAMRSSSTASASRKMRTRVGRNRPNTASTPSAKAMSVAVGMGQPSTVGVPAVNARKIAAGTIDAADRGDRGQQRLRERVELADDELALQLDGDDEEEDREQPVADPVPGREVEPEPRQVEVRVLQVDDGGSERQVRDDEAEHGGDEEQCGGEALGAEDVHGTPVGKSRCDGRCARGTSGDGDDVRRRPTRLPGTPPPILSGRVTAAPSMAGTARRRSARRRRERPWATSGTMRSARPRRGCGDRPARGCLGARRARRDRRAAARARRLPLGRRPDPREPRAVPRRGVLGAHRGDRGGRPRRDDRGARRRALPGALPRRPRRPHARRGLRHPGCRGAHDGQDGVAASARLRRRPHGRDRRRRRRRSGTS